MDILILCGGRGERLMPLTEKTPASLLRIAGKEVILYTMEQVEKTEVKSVILSSGYGENQLKRFFETGFWHNIRIDFSKTDRNSTASAIKSAVKNFNDEDIMIIESNCIFDFDLKSAYEFHKSRGALCTAVVNNKSYNNSVKICINENDRIIGYGNNTSEETCGENGYLTGVYIINKSIFETFDFSDNKDFVYDILFEAVKNNDNILAYEDRGYYKKIIEPKEFLECQKDILMLNENQFSNHGSEPFPGVSIEFPCFIGKNVDLFSGAKIKKYSVIDDGSTIKSKASVDGGYVGKYAFVGYGTCIKKSVISSGAVVMDNVYCGENSAIGENSFVGSDSRINDNIKIYSDKKIKSGSEINKNIVSGESYEFMLDEDGICIFEKNITPDTAARIGMSIAAALKKNSCIAIGYSGDINSEIIYNSLINGLVFSGAEVFTLDKCSESQLMYTTACSSSDIGVYIKNVSRVKVRIFSKCGLPLTWDTEKRITDSFNKGYFKQIKLSECQNIFPAYCYKEMYIKYIEKFLPDKLTGVNCMFRTCDKRSAELADRLFHKRNDIDGKKIIFNMSPDLYKISAYSEDTGYVVWERLMGLCEKIYFEKGKKFSVPFEFPYLADKIAEDKSGMLYRYNNCSFDDSDLSARQAAMDRSGLIVRDGLMTAAVICGYLSNENISLEQALSDVPMSYTSKRFINFNGERSDIMNIVPNKKSGLNEGVVMENGESRVVIRPLKCGGGLNLFVESFSCEQASSICDELIVKIKKLQIDNGKSL